MVTIVVLGKPQSFVIGLGLIELTTESFAIFYYVPWRFIELVRSVFHLGTTVHFLHLDGIEHLHIQVYGVLV